MFIKDTFKKSTMVVSILINLIVLMNIILLSILHKVLRLGNLILIGLPSCPQEQFFTSTHS